MRIIRRAMRAGWVLLAVPMLAAACSSPAATTEVPDPTSTPTPSPPPPSSTPEPLAARVGDEGIALAAYEREVARFEAAQTALGIDLATLGDYRTEVLWTLIDRRLLAQTGVALSGELSESELEERMQELIEARGGFSGMDEWLETAGYTAEEFRSELHEEILAARAIEAIAESLPENVDQVHARHIVVRTREEAEDLLAQLEDGADFAELAALHSLDASTRPAGGDLGWFPRGLLTAPEIETTAFRLQPDQLSEVVETILGFHVVQSLGRESRPLNGEALTYFRVYRVEQWLEEQRIAVGIEVFIDAVP